VADAMSYEFVRGAKVDYSQELIKSAFEVGCLLTALYFPGFSPPPLPMSYEFVWGAKVDHPQELIKSAFEVGCLLAAPFSLKYFPDD